MTQVAPISQRIWDMKYRLKMADGVPVDKSTTDTWRRVARALAEVEKDPQTWEETFFDAMDDYQFLPAGRILAGAGTGRRVTLFNCFVMGAIPDDLGGIFEHLKEAALTMQQGGGIGYDFSTLRPKGAPVHGVGADASGPLSFMDVWDAMCRTIMSAGSRRGAMMATLRCDHPDIETFIAAKEETGRLRMFNLSVLVSDLFLQAVAADAPWNLVFGDTVFRTVRARDLWDRIMRATYHYAEPGVIFIDRVNRLNNLYYCESITATNPCGEQPLPAYGTCLLGSINLARLVVRPFDETAELDLARLRHLVRVAVRMLDNVIEISNFPLPAQRHEAISKRRIGLGLTGLANALILCGARYGSKRAVHLAETWMAAIESEAYLTSADLAGEKGAFPLYDAERYLAGATVAALPEAVRSAIARHGIRNALLTSIAPTGTISLFADNVSSGIEPVFSFTYSRSLLLPDGSREEEQVTDFAYQLFQRLHGDQAPLPDSFVDAAALTPTDHLVMQAAVQKHVDSSISKTINVDEAMPFEAFKDIYLQANALGCKGCTTYRPNDVTGAVLARTDTRSEPPAPDPGDIVYMSHPLNRPVSLPGQTYKIRWPDSDHATYITINDIVQEGPAQSRGRVRPFEVFINSKNMEHYAWTVALTRMISAVFRRGGDVSFVVEELKAVFDPRGGQWMDGRYVPSLLAAIGDVIERHMIAIGFLPHAITLADAKQPEAERARRHFGSETYRHCPKCGLPSLVRLEGCDTCNSCAYSRCG
ncbi:MAG: adenosylcobalamin-dependent ribonucleoside-diphosphate reductase [Alphaproteobacteria bacterium]|nr:adenosylcobalamin-dependent ribonucleoside-diphosphate reductase [Alphaproteobacteria bacterium]